MKPVRIHGDNWMDTDMKMFCDDYEAGMDTAVMAIKYNVAVSSIKVLAHNFGAGYRNPPLSEEEKIWLADNAKSYPNSKVLCRAMNKELGTERSPDSFSQMLNRHNIPFKNQGANKLTDEERAWLLKNSKKYSGSFMICRAMNIALGTQRREDCFGRILLRNRIPFKRGGRYPHGKFKQTA